MYCKMCKEMDKFGMNVVFMKKEVNFFQKGT